MKYEQAALFRDLHWQVTDYLCHLRINWQYSDSILVARVVFLVLGSELITEVRVPYGLVDVVASYYAQEPVNRHIGFGRSSGRHLRKRSQ